MLARDARSVAPMVEGAPISGHLTRRTLRPQARRRPAHAVTLRLCRTCGHVGCCDDSPNRHATKHFHATRHPIIECGSVGATCRGPPTRC
jgi:hypothetical protein